MTDLLSTLVPEAAARHGARCAFRDPQDRITYEELERKTSRLAAFLRSNGAAEGDRVAICMPSSVLTAICVHGVFRAGCAFVPVDPELPANRIRTILNDCGVRYVLATPQVKNVLTEATRGLDPLVVGSDMPRAQSWQQVWERPPEEVECAPDPDRLAYVMYTSGSTGTPKGIGHTQASAMAYVRNSMAVYGVTHEDVIATTAPLHFDVSTFSYLTATAAAATSVIVPQPYARLPASMAEVFDKARVTIFYTTASALAQFVQRGALDTRNFASMRWILFCGEPMPPAQLSQAMRAFPTTWFSNSYGPAEVNQCTYFHIPPGTPIESFGGAIPIGQPWDGAICRILAEEGEAQGELAVSAPSMMAGYWQRPDLDRTAFLRLDGRTYYRTGDIAYRNRAGEYVLVGRSDRQVKIRGFRVELDEIEITLAEHPEVLEAATYAYSEAGAGVQIGAAVLTRSEDPALRVGLMKFLATRLPAYHVPSRMELLRALPRTTSGKIDRRTLSMEASERTCQST